jgi:iron complex outermembrane receptor protein
LPFVPAIGASYLLLSREKNSLKINGNIAKSYRVPTFNDRYWVPGGNPNLLPEKGINYELGLHYGYYSKQIQGSIKINTFFMDIDNWLLWRNGGSYWYVDNVQRVKSKGVEVNGEIKYKIGEIELINTLNYAYTNAKRIESLVESSALGRQLEYVPLHSTVAFVSFSYKKVNFSTDASFTNEQYTDETDGNILPSCFLLNMSAGYKFRINAKHQFRMKAMVHNILNTNYQSSVNYAMPRINYRISLIYNFN